MLSTLSIGITLAVIAYYIVHEGAHTLYAICSSVFKEINFMGIGMQIDIYADKMMNILKEFFSAALPLVLGHGVRIALQAGRA